MGAFVVQDMQFRGVTLVDEETMCGFPGVTDAGAFAVWNADGMDGIGILVVENEHVVVSAAGRDGKQACLIGVGLENVVLVKDSGANVVRACVKRRRIVERFVRIG